MALMVLVYERTGSPAAAGAMLVCSQVIPAGLLALAGSRADRWNVRRSLALGFGAQAGAVAAVVTTPIPLFALAVPIGLAGAVIRAQLRAGLAVTAGDELLREGSALLNCVRGVTSLLGPAVAALSLASVGSTATLLGVALLLLTAGLAARLAPLPDRSAAEIAEDNSTVATGRPERIPVDRTMVLLLGLVGLMLAALSVDEPILLAYVQREIDGGVAGYGALLTAWGAGMLIGTGIFSRLIDRPMLAVFAGATAVSGLAHLGLALAPSLPVAIAFALVGGISGGIDWAALSTAIMERAPKGREASVATRLEAVATAAPGLGFVVGGVLASDIAPRSVLLLPAAYGLLVAVVACGAWLFSRRVTLPAVALPSVQPNATPRGI